MTMTQARRVALPTDVPPGARAALGPRNVAGLVTHGSLGQVVVKLFARPWSTLQSTVFPLSLPSAVAPNAIRPVWVVAVNKYSPIAHRSTLTTVEPPKAISARGVGVPTQRPRPYAAGFVTAWPQSAPRWPTWGEAPGARGGA